MKTTFEMNGKAYEADEETLQVLRGIVPAAKASNDSSAVIAVMTLGQQCGRIVEIEKSLKEIGKALRDELNTAFPNVKFSVTTKRFTGGSSISIDWFFGPTDKQVDAIAKKYSQDHRYVHTNRHYDASNFTIVHEQACRDLCALCGIEYTGIWTKVQNDAATTQVYRILLRAELPTGYHGLRFTGVTCGNLDEIVEAF